MANEIARKLRKAMTPQEVRLWVKLRELRALGHHFRRQSPVLTYIVDFECRLRDENLRRAGYKILRFANPEIDRELDAVMETILSALNSVDPTRLLASRGATLPFGEG